MATATRARAGQQKITATDEQNMAELAAVLAKASLLYRRLARKFSHFGGVIPAFGKVKIIAPPDEFEDAAGEEGIVLGGGQLSSGEQTYTVLIPSRDETLYLNRIALHFTGEVARASDVYKRASVRVSVSPDGSGHPVTAPTRRAKASHR